MDGIREWTIEAQNVKSLCWRGDALIDWVDGGSEYDLDGTARSSQRAFSYRFDAAVTSPSGIFTVIYEKRGTKGLILKNGAIIREINRSYYHAHAYEYPVVLFRRANGQEVIAHCPESYDRVDIDDLDTGKRLTDGPDRKPVDFFHSRLAVDHTGTFLLSAGWVWHPWDTIKIYDVEAVLADPHLLDGGGCISPQSAEVSSAAFLGDDKVILTSSTEKYDGEEMDPTELRPNSLAVYDIRQKHFLSQVTLEAVVGTIMPVGADWIIGFYDHPRLIDLRTGKTLHQWSNLNSGKQDSSIIWHIDPMPPLALDPSKARFAVADESAIHVVQIDTLK